MSSPSPAVRPLDPEYLRVLDYLFGRIDYERTPSQHYASGDFNLTRMGELLTRLGDPQKHVPCVHIAGTKGKGSTAAMTASVLKAAGYRVGLYTSPHIVRYEERFRIDMCEAPPGELATLIQQMLPTVAQLDDEGIRATFFELTTALAWLWFKARQVDIAVMEVGLGGRLDSTNICEPEVTAVTSISRDHMRQLGDTLDLITREKCGIFKPGIPAVSGVQAPESFVVQSEASRAGCPLIEIDAAVMLANVHPLPHADPVAPKCYGAAIHSPHLGVVNAELPLAGMHQTRNAAVVVGILSELHQRGWKIPIAAIEEGIRSVHWPLRIEVIRHRPLVIVDAAHNDASMVALCDIIRELPARRKVLIFGASKDKEVDVLLRTAGRVFDIIVLTQYLHNPRATAPSALAELASQHLTIPWLTADTPAEAWALASRASTKEDVICASGSFFMASEVREMLVNV